MAPAPPPDSDKKKKESSKAGKEGGAIEGEHDDMASVDTVEIIREWAGDEDADAYEFIKGTK